MLFVPVNAGLNVNARLTVRLFPEVETEETPASRVHWLLASVPGVPNSAEPTYPSPESCTRTSVFVARVYCTKHEPGAASCVLKRTSTKLMFAAPDGSLYTKPNNRVAPVPVAGDTETFAGGPLPRAVQMPLASHPENRATALYAPI